MNDDHNGHGDIASSIQAICLTVPSCFPVECILRDKIQGSARYEGIEAPEPIMHGCPSEDLLLAVLIVVAQFEPNLVLIVCHPHVDALVEDEIYKDGKGCASDLVEGVEDVIIIAGS